MAGGKVQAARDNPHRQGKQYSGWQHARTLTDNVRRPPCEFSVWMKRVEAVCSGLWSWEDFSLKLAQNQRSLNPPCGRQAPMIRRPSATNVGSLCGLD